MVTRIQLLGPLSIQTSDGTPITLKGQSAVLLCYLLLNPGLQNREQIAQMLYPQSLNPRSNLATVLNRLQKKLKTDLIYSDRSQLGVLQSTDVSVDVWEWRERLAAAQNLWRLPTQDRLALTSSLYETIQLYQGELFSGYLGTDSVEFEDWLQIEREFYRREYIEWSRRLCQLYRLQGELSAAEAHIQNVIRTAPFEEEFHIHLISIFSERDEYGKAIEHAEGYCDLLKTELDLAPSDDLIYLMDWLTLMNGDLDRPIPEQPAIKIVEPYGVPRNTVEIIGRKEQMQRIMRRFISGNNRLITLIGLGGMGKTTLALEVAAQLESVFRHGSIFISMREVNGDGDVQQVAYQMGLQIAGAFGAEVDCIDSEDETDQVKIRSILADKEILMVCDNCEHLLEGAPIFKYFLEYAPNLRILVTSRERLQLSVEAVEMVDGLPFEFNQPIRFPIETHRLPEALQLFVSRATQNHAEFEINRDNIHDILRIVSLVGGMPLAIEMAANWITLFTPREIANLIQDSPGALASHHVDIPDRHQNLMGIVQQSWDLLHDHHRRFLAELSLFSGHFSPVDALHVTGESPMTLLQMHDKSMVQKRDRGEFLLHPLIRLFASEQLEKRPDMKVEAEKKFAKHILSACIALQNEPVNYDATRAETLKTRELDLVAAWNLAAEHRLCTLLADSIRVFTMFGIHTADAKSDILLGFNQVIDHLEQMGRRNKVESYLLAHTLYGAKQLHSVIARNNTILERLHNQ